MTDPYPEAKMVGEVTPTRMIRSSKTFELHKFYQHFGSTRLHIIAEADRSEMWKIDDGHKMLIAETREGQLQPISTIKGSGNGWYEITKEIFVDDIKFTDYEFIPHYEKTDSFMNKFMVRVYENGDAYLFDITQVSDELYEPVHKNDKGQILKWVKENMMDNKVHHTLLESLEKALMGTL